jgi:hypothetical protein
VCTRTIPSYPTRLQGWSLSYMGGRGLHRHTVALRISMRPRKCEGGDASSEVCLLDGQRPCRPTVYKEKKARRRRRREGNGGRDCGLLPAFFFVGVSESLLPLFECQQKQQPCTENLNWPSKCLAFGEKGNGCRMPHHHTDTKSMYSLHARLNVERARRCRERRVMREGS